MGICSDQATNYLKSLNLNTIRQPQEGVDPLMLLGIYKGARGIIGTLDQLAEPGGVAPQPTVRSSAAANINGKRTSKMPLALGLDILGGVIGAMGGNLGIKASYEAARTVEFEFRDVTLYRPNQIEIGDFLEKSEIRWDHVILKRYLIGDGKLYVITDVVKSKKVAVTAYRSDKSALAIEIPAVQQIVGGKVSVDRDSDASTTITYEGEAELAFGFQAIELAAGQRGDDGEIDVVYRPVRAGDASFSLSRGATSNSVFVDFEGAIDALKRLDPEAL